MWTCKDLTQITQHYFFYYAWREKRVLGCVWIVEIANVKIKSWGDMGSMMGRSQLEIIRRNQNKTLEVVAGFPSCLLLVQIVNGWKFRCSTILRHARRRILFVIFSVICPNVLTLIPMSFNTCSIQFFPFFISPIELWLCIGILKHLVSVLPRARTLTVITWVFSNIKK